VLRPWVFAEEIKKTYQVSQLPKNQENKKNFFVSGAYNAMHGISDKYGKVFGGKEVQGETVESVAANAKEVAPKSDFTRPAYDTLIDSLFLCGNSLSISDFGKNVIRPYVFNSILFYVPLLEIFMKRFSSIMLIKLDDECKLLTKVFEVFRLDLFLIGRFAWLF
jgi:hypothetical protein